MKKEILQEKQQYSYFVPFYAGRAQNLIQKSARLERMKKELDDASPWMFYYEMSVEVKEQCHTVVKSIKDSVANLYHEWVSQMGDNPQLRLNCSLLRYDNNQKGHLECNMDPVILVLCHETSYWKNLQFDIPVHIRIVYDKWSTLHYVHQSVIALAAAYNDVIEG